ncbi:GNAT acetyltransferase 2-domain-containing protein [Hyaloraphidium curvatum]|nr:GNAT acetyltransferase 2-domain-containing protein [Hyaloraphidium curvatum]
MAPTMPSTKKAARRDDPSSSSSEDERRPAKKPAGKPANGLPNGSAKPAAAPQRKKLDPRIPALINASVAANTRSLFVLVGDHGRDQVVNLHFLLSKARHTARPSVLWCYKKELGFSSHRKKRMKQIKKEVARGLRDPDADDPFELFVASTDIRYAYYKESHKILGNTYGMCVLQDFEALTPNLLAQTMETVEGGGIVVILLRTMTSLKQLYTMTMDVHARYRTAAHGDVVNRFNERLVLSLGDCSACIVADDELNVLPLSGGKYVKPAPALDAEAPEKKELAEVVESFNDVMPVYPLVKCARTVDQAKALLTFIDAASEKTLRSTVALTAARGRGKSAALGLAMAAAIAHGYSNIFVTSPSPENLRTLFSFVFKGFDALGYQEHLDYAIHQSTHPSLAGCIVRVSVFRTHRQTIQYVAPQDAHVLTQAELVVIDEAAAIPLPLVKQMMGNWLVFMASTINGYEGTGRGLSLKLLKGLREEAGKASEAGKGEKLTARVLREIKLETPIRYAPNDPVEKWLNDLLCLDCCTPRQSRLLSGVPDPSVCDLYAVDRDTLFSYHPISEAFLQRMMALYVASHYKNSPNDLQLMSDAPAHQLFVLLPPVDQAAVAASGSAVLPEPLCVVQVCLEGRISRPSVMNALARGQRPDGDLIPWLVSQQYQDDSFAALSGARVVRIATHPDHTGMGYGGRALELLSRYYNGDLVNLSEDDEDEELAEGERRTNGSVPSSEKGALQSEVLRVKDPSKMPPLLRRVQDRPLKERLHWIGVSYGITPPLHKFWKRHGFLPLYVRQTPNELTGEHTCVMLRPLQLDPGMDAGWLDVFAADFKRRFLELAGFGQFRDFPPALVLSLIEAAGGGQGAARKLEGAGVPAPLGSLTELRRHFNPFDLKRLESYANSMLDYHVVLDMIPQLARLYFSGALSPSSGAAAGPDDGPGSDQRVALNPLQAAILVGIGLQKKSIDDLEAELGLPAAQLLALFTKVCRKCSSFFKWVESRSVELELLDEEVATKERLAKAAAARKAAEEAAGGAVAGKKRALDDEEQWDPTGTTLAADLDDAANDSMRAFRAKQKELIDSMDLSQYAITAETDEIRFDPSKSGSKIVSVESKGGKKKKSRTPGKGESAAELASKLRGEGNGLVGSQVALEKAKKPKYAKMLR